MLEATLKQLEGFDQTAQYRVPQGFNPAFSAYLSTGDTAELDALDWERHTRDGWDDYFRSGVDSIVERLRAPGVHESVTDETIAPVLARMESYSAHAAAAVDPVQNVVRTLQEVRAGLQVLAFLSTVGDALEALSGRGDSYVLKDHEAYERLKGAERAALSVTPVDCVGCYRSESVIADSLPQLFPEAVVGSIRAETPELLARVQREYPGAYEPEGHSTVLILRSGEEVSRYSRQNPPEMEDLQRDLA